MKYTLVRHSAYEVKRDNDFRYAVEEFGIADNMLHMVRKAGGLVFDSYKEAYDAALAYNYPPGVTGVIPKVEGRFRNVGQVRSLFIPAKIPEKKP